MWGCGLGGDAASSGHRRRGPSYWPCAVRMGYGSTTLKMLIPPPPFLLGASPRVLWWRVVAVPKPPGADVVQAAERRQEPGPDALLAGLPSGQLVWR